MIFIVRKNQHQLVVPPRGQVGHFPFALMALMGLAGRPDPSRYATTLLPAFAINKALGVPMESVILAAQTFLLQAWNPEFRLRNFSGSHFRMSSASGWLDTTRGFCCVIGGYHGYFVAYELSNLDGFPTKK